MFLNEHWRVSNTLKMHLNVVKAISPNLVHNATRTETNLSEFDICGFVCLKVLDRLS